MPHQRRRRSNKMQFPAASYHILPGSSKYLFKHSDVKHHKTLSFFNVKDLTTNAQVRSQVSSYGIFGG
jgi:hypothetical protein